jgi:hypothetical protein
MTDHDVDAPSGRESAEHRVEQSDAIIASSPPMRRSTRPIRPVVAAAVAWSSSSAPPNASAITA